jgi:hypothetical protein
VRELPDVREKSGLRTGDKDGGQSQEKAQLHI